MSRIHEALKKAEQERTLASSAESVQAESPVVAEETRRATPPTAVADRPTGMVELRDVLNFQDLATRAKQMPWNPDPERLLFCNSHNHALGSEEFRRLRTRLYQLRQKNKLHTLLITSALPKEGKTFVAANLAQIIGRQQGRRVLLIDADLRCSQLHTLLGAPQTPGLTDYLKSEADEFAIMQRGPQENLFFIPGGTRASNPLELLGNGHLKNLLERVGAAFDWVILDSPPAIPVSDPSLLADMTDGVLLVLHSAVTPLDMALKIREEFQHKHLLGVVLNQSEPRLGYGSYYYGYGNHEKSGG